MMSHNVVHGCAVEMSKWHVIHKDDYAIRMEFDYLVSPAVMHNVVLMYPCGTFQCMKCKREGIHMDSVALMHYNKDIQGLVCCECRETGNIPVYFRDENVATVEQSPYVTYEDRRPKNEDERKKKAESYYEFCEMIAANNNKFIFLDGKSTKDFYREMLGRRVIRRWKEFVRKRRVASTFKFLHRTELVGLHGAMKIAKSIV